MMVIMYRKNSFNPKVIAVTLLGAKMECGSSILVFEFKWDTFNKKINYT